MQEGSFIDNKNKTYAEFIIFYESKYILNNRKLMLDTYYLTAIIVGVERG